MLTSPRREALADAALAVLARDGSRGLSHRAVDREAGVAEGTTSYYFRKRGTLLEATVQRLADADTQAISALPDRSVEALIDALASAVTQPDGSTPQRQLARLELTLEGLRHPELQRVLAVSGRTVHTALADALRSLTVPDPGETATALLVTVDGLLTDRLAGAAARVADLGDVRRLLLRALTVDGR